MLYQLEDAYNFSKDSADFTERYEKMRTAWLISYDQRHGKNQEDAQQ